MKVAVETLALPPGFRLSRRALDVPAHVWSLPWEQRSIRMFGRSVPMPRLTCWFGATSYSYSGQMHGPADTPAWLDALRVDIEHRTGATYNSVLGNLYRDGRDSVAWHSDDEPELGPTPTIASLSIGAPRPFAIRHKKTRERWVVELRDGDLLVMSGSSQANYEHELPKVRGPVGRRVNLTFRRILGVDK